MKSSKGLICHGLGQDLMKYIKLVEEYIPVSGSGRNREEYIPYLTQSCLPLGAWGGLRYIIVALPEPSI